VSPGAAMAALGGVLAVAGAASWWRRVGWKARVTARRGLDRSVSAPHRAPPHWFERLLTALGVGGPDGPGLDPAQTWPVVSAVLLVLAVVAIVMAPIGSIAVGGAAAAGLVVARRRPRRAVFARADLVGAVETMAATLRSGASVHQAVERAGSAAPGAVGTGLRAVALQTRQGMRLDLALSEWAAGLPANAAAVAHALDLAAASGAGHAAALDAVADALRSRERLRREVRALAGQARASAMVLVALPVVFAAGAALTAPGVSRFLLRSPGGWACLASGVGLDAVGAWWMARQISAVR
jgi:tight adherence protein B